MDMRRAFVNNQKKRACLAWMARMFLAALSVLASADRLPFENRFDHWELDLEPINDPSDKQGSSGDQEDVYSDKPSPAGAHWNEKEIYRVYYRAEDGSAQSFLYEPHSNVNATAQTVVKKLDKPSGAFIRFAYLYTIRNAADSRQPIRSFTIRMAVKKGAPVLLDRGVISSSRWRSRPPLHNPHGRNWTVWTYPEKPLPPGEEADFELQSAGLPGIVAAFIQGKPRRSNPLNPKAPIPNEPGEDAVCGWVVGPVPEPKNFHPIAFIEHIEALYWKSDLAGWIHSHKEGFEVLRALDTARSALKNGDAATARQAVLDGIRWVQPPASVPEFIEYPFTTEAAGLLTHNMEYLAEKLKLPSPISARRPTFEGGVDLPLLRSVNLAVKEVPPDRYRIYYLDYDDAVRSMLYVPECNLDASVQTVVQKLKASDDPAVRYAYAYTIRSAASSLQPVRSFKVHMQIDRRSPTTLVSPEPLRWNRRAPSPDSKGANWARWHASIGRSRLIQPGETYGGFQLRSSGLPGVLKASVQGSGGTNYGHESIEFPDGTRGDETVGYVVGPVPEPSPFEAGAFLEYVEQLCRRCIKIGWAAQIAGKEAAQAVQEARRLWKTGDRQAARRRLEAAVERLRQGSEAERDFTTEAAGMLTANLEYLLERL